jgi:hypothetical protein
MCLCHDENQKHKITHEEQQNRIRYGLSNPAHPRAVTVMVGRRRRSSVNRIKEIIKKCQKSQNPCNSVLKPIIQRHPSYHQASRLVIVFLGLPGRLVRREFFRALF